jgi:hypothetical protein
MNVVVVIFSAEILVKEKRNQFLLPIQIKYIITCLTFGLSFSEKAILLKNCSNNRIFDES